MWSDVADVPQVWIASFHPLCKNAQGRKAVSGGLPPFIDGACRREPDLEAPYPSISELCRPGVFAHKLEEGQQVVYVTVKRAYGQAAHHRYVARLTVLKVLKSHEAAADWYRAGALSLPSNCMVTGSLPVEYHETSGGDTDVRSYPLDVRLKYWDGYYRRLAKKSCTFVACSVEYRELFNPPVIETVDWIETIGRVPGTQTPTRFPLSDVLALESRVLQKPRPSPYPVVRTDRA